MQSLEVPWKLVGEEQNQKSVKNGRAADDCGEAHAHW